MKLLELILFFIVFTAIIILFCVYINKTEKEITNIKNRQSLEAQNDEFEYGHNVDYKLKDE